MEGLTESIEIPGDAPGGDVLFAWNWFNEEGNREMYEVSLWHGEPSF